MEKISKNHNFDFRNLKQKVTGTLKNIFGLYFVYLELLRQKENEIRLVNSKLHSIVSNKEIYKVKKMYIITGKEIKEWREGKYNK